MIVYKVKLLKTKVAWKIRNRHNKTYIENVTDLNSVSVGNCTYGPLKVLNDSSQYRLQIGHYCSIAEGVTFIVCSEHPTDRISTFPFKVKCLQTQTREAISKGDIIVEDDVWIGYGATILSGVRIGQGAVVAAGSVVTKDIPPYAIVGGIPAKVIKYRFNDEMIRELLKVDYGKITKEMVADHVSDLYEPLVSVEKLQWLPRKNNIGEIK